ncbi:L-lactate permease [Longispora albida]|uniref:L-lactate permease n=1 Tax=Longispora albida TaxID=203523 RepID=UPI00037EC1FE|nr:L-lactate permease [Longispora albida]
MTTAAGLLLFGKGHGASVSAPPWAAVRPYAIVLGLVFLIRMLPFAGVPVSALAIKAGGVSFAPLSSPGLALGATVLILGGGRLAGPALKATVLRGYKPVLALAGFTVMAQLMVGSGMIQAIGAALPSSSVLALAGAAPLLGMVSGYLTGSNVGGNALMMTMQTTLGTGVGEPLAFAAIQNSTAGHAVFASMPIVLLVLAISGGARDGEEPELVRYGLRMAALVAAVTVAASLALVTLG